MTATSGRHRVCVLTSSFPSGPRDNSGVFVQRQVLQLAHSVDITVVYPSRGMLPPYEEVPFVRHPVRYPFRAPMMSLVRGFDAFHSASLFASMARAARVGGPYDLYHAYWAIPAGFVGSFVSGRKPLVVWLGGSDVNLFAARPGFREAVRWSLKRATRVIAVSHDLLEKAVGLGLDRERGTAIPSGVNTEQFRPLDREDTRLCLGLPQSFLFVCVGDLLPVKRVDRLVRVMAHAPVNLDCRLVVVGDGPERPALERLAQEIHARVHFLGQLPSREVALVMAACDAFAMASESEGLPTSAQEAMSCGLPVVALDVGGLREIVTNGETGYLAEDEAELGRSMYAIASDPESARFLGGRARVLALNSLSVESCVQRTLQVYQEALEGPR